ncbi:hypothetical protein L0156_20365 [bacterium]|nr:hypothetical protein [bacterium]
MSKATWEYRYFQSHTPTARERIPGEQLLHKYGIDINTSEGTINKAQYRLEHIPHRDRTETIEVSFPSSTGNYFSFLQITQFQNEVLSVDLFFLSDEDTEFTHRLYDSSKGWARYEQAWNEYLSGYLQERPFLPDIKLPYALRESFLLLIDPSKEGIYGFFCDVAGMAPAKRRAIMRLLDAKQYSAIRHVLHSHSNVSKVYAAEALMMLRNDGEVLDPTDEQIITGLKAREDSIEVCEGCEHSNRKIRDILSEAEKLRLPDLLQLYRLEKDQ